MATITLKGSFLNDDNNNGVDVIQGFWNSTLFGSSQCWGCRPLLWRHAFDTTITTTTNDENDESSTPFPSWMDIVKLACHSEEEDDDDDDDFDEEGNYNDATITSRLIQHQPGTLDTFTVDFGPFDLKQLQEQLLMTNNDNSNNQSLVVSTLLVNDVDRYIPSLSDWMDETFDFLPRWRRDDAQVSLATMGGGIGPHVDNYDVFLIQLKGSRLWQVSLDKLSELDEFTHLVEPSQVRILNLTSMSTIKTIQIQVDAGDCLYIPPRIMHCGTSTSNDCITLSVGCRAPSALDLLTKITESLATITTTTTVTTSSLPLSLTSLSSLLSIAMERYTDMDLFQTSPNEKHLSPRIKEKMKQLVLQLVQEFVENEDLWDDVIGRFVTSSNRPTTTTSTTDDYYPMPLKMLSEEWKQELGVWANAKTTLESILNGNGILRRAEGISFAWSYSSRSSAPTTTSTTTYNLYAQCQKFQLVMEQGNDNNNNMDSMHQFMNLVANGRSIIYGHQLKPWNIQNSPNMKQFLLELIEEGFLYGDDNDESSRS